MRRADAGGDSCEIAARCEYLWFDRELDRAQPHGLLERVQALAIRLPQGVVGSREHLERAGIAVSDRGEDFLAVPGGKPLRYERRELRGRLR